MRCFHFNRVLHLAITATIILQLTGCGFYDRVREDEWGPRALLNPARITPKSPRTTATISNDWSTPNTRPSEYDQFYAIEKSLNASRTDGGNVDPQLLAQYVQQGIVLSDTVCYAWFDLLERAQANTQFWKNNAVITAATATTIMGAADAAAKEIAIVAAAFAGMNSAFENFQSTFLFAPDMHTIRKRIEGARETAIKTKFVDDPPATYEEAKRRLLKYHQLCSGAEIRDLIQTAVVTANYSFDPGSWSTKVTAASAAPAVPAVNIDAARTEFALAGAKAARSFAQASEQAPAQLATALAEFRHAHAAIAALAAELDKAGAHPSRGTEDSLSKVVLEIGDLDDYNAAVQALAATQQGGDNTLPAAAQRLAAAHTDLRVVAERLRELHKAYAVAEVFP